MGRIHDKFVVCCAGAIAVLLCAPAISHAITERSDGEAVDLTASCTIVQPEDYRRKQRITDGDVKTYSKIRTGTSLRVRWTDDEAVAGLYLKWYKLPSSFTLSEFDGDGNLLAWQTVEAPLYNAYYTVDTATREITVESENALYLSEAMLFSDGTLPDGAFDWSSPAEKADILVIAAHPDDELLYFGGTLPTYAGQRGLNVQVVYLTYDERARIDEALSGLWTCGVRNAPVFLDFRDVYTETLEEAEASWGRDTVTEAIVEAIRRFRPEVIVTHDLNGEYGHGAHMLVAACTLDAVSAAADGELFADSAQRYGVWQTQKLYLHLYGEGTITMDWRVPLSAFDGKTALEVANLAYARHLSQQSFQHAVYDTGKYSSAEFGLAFSVVGADEDGDDFLEHIDPARLSDYTEPEADAEAQAEPADTQALPEATATPVQTPADTAATPEPVVSQGISTRGRWIVLAAAVTLILICLVLLLRIKGDPPGTTMKNRNER